MLKTDWKRDNARDSVCATWKTKSKTPALLFWVAAWMATSVPNLIAGSISGKLDADDGALVGAVLQLHDLSTPRVSGSSPFDREFSSKRDGTFSLDGVPQGKYEICVDAPQSAVLDPCFWETSRRIVEVKNANDSTRVHITVKKGYVMQVRVNDPQQLLPQAAGPMPGPSLALRVVTAERRSQSLRLLSADSAGRELFAVIPYGTPVRLSVASPALALSDQANVRVQGDATSIPVLISKGQTVTPIVFQVAPK